MGWSKPSQLNKLLVLQKRALRFIHFAKPRDHAIPLFINTKILPINFLYYQLLAETMSDLRNNLVPTNIQELFLPLSCVHSYGTRSSTSQNFYRKKIESWNKKKSLSRDLVPNYGMRYRPSCALQGGKTFCASFCASLIAGSRRAFSVSWLGLFVAGVEWNARGSNVCSL